MSDNFDISDILGANFQELMTTSENNEEEVKNEIVPVSSEDLEQKIISDTNNITAMLDETIKDVLLQVSASPTDPDLMGALAKLLKSRSDVSKSILDVYLNKEKFKQNVALTSMKLTSQKQMNTENNIARMTMRRDDIMKQVAIKREEERAKKAIDADIIEDSSQN